VRLNEFNDVLMEHGAYLALASPEPAINLLGSVAADDASRLLTDRTLSRPRIIQAGANFSYSLMQRAINFVASFTGVVKKLLSKDDGLYVSVRQLNSDLQGVQRDLAPRPLGDDPLDTTKFTWVAVDSAKLIG
jgi:hypothetical protein